jgi:hypothetical protein
VIAELRRKWFGLTKAEKAEIGRITEQLVGPQGWWVELMDPSGLKAPGYERKFLGDDLLPSTRVDWGAATFGGQVDHAVLSDSRTGVIVKVPLTHQMHIPPGCTVRLNLDLDVHRATP